MSSFLMCDHCGADLRKPGVGVVLLRVLIQSGGAAPWDFCSYRCLAAWADAQRNPWKETRDPTLKP